MRNHHFLVMKKKIIIVIIVLLAVVGTITLVLMNTGGGATEKDMKQGEETDKEMDNVLEDPDLIEMPTIEGQNDTISGDGFEVEEDFDPEDML